MEPWVQQESQAEPWVRQESQGSAWLGRHRGRTVYFDTNVFVYVLNGAPGLAEAAVAWLEACLRGDIFGVTGELTLAELLVQPLRLNDAAAVATVRDLMLSSGAVSLLPHDRSCFERAALLRARHGLKMPDALHLATAQGAGAACFITNDRQLPSIDGLDVMGLRG